jgi:hypothetical protein
VTDFLSFTGDLFVRILLPILIFVGIGAVVQWRVKVDLMPLSRLQIYLFVPVFLFVRVFDSTLSWGQMGTVVGSVLLIKVLLAVPLYFLLKRLQVPATTVPTVLLAATIFNAGNFGIPVAERAFGKEGGAIQALIVMISNLSLWGMGAVVVNALSGGSFKEAARSYLKLPMVYMMLSALGMKALGVRLPEFVASPLHQIADALVPVALLTLGMQLAQQGRAPRWKVLTPVILLKLVALPLVAAAVVVALGMWPHLTGQVVIVAAAGPTAVNTMLLTMEQKGDVALAAECVFWTTIFSVVTVMLILAVVMSLTG